jgi:hypothetical protein
MFLKDSFSHVCYNAKKCIPFSFNVFLPFLNTVDSGYNEPAFSELPAIVNATLGIRMFSHKTFFIRL